MAEHDLNKKGVNVLKYLHLFNKQSFDLRLYLSAGFFDSVLGGMGPRL